MRPVKILLIEDDEEDIITTLEAFAESAMGCTIAFTRDAEGALDYLYQRNSYLNADRPDFIVLDINLPRINGTQLLHTLKSDPCLATIPVFVLSTLPAPSEFMKATAQMFFTKPNSSSGYLGLINSMGKYMAKLQIGEMK